MKNLKLAACVILGAAALTCSAVAIAGCTDTEKSSWDVSADASSSVKAELAEYEGGTELLISGNGTMADFGTNGAPWNGRNDEITRIRVTHGVTHVGANAFDGLTSAEYVILPSSVTSTGAGFAGEQLKAFVFEDNIAFEGGAPALLYTYSEDEIETTDRFWQSDQSKGDIIGDDEDLSDSEDGRYWRYVSENSNDAMVYEKLKVLFIGNSFTYRNGTSVAFNSGVPGLFDGVAEDLGFATETYSITGPGWYLDSHANPNDTCGRQVDKLLNACDDFDYIVLQDNSTASYRANERFNNGVEKLKELIENTQTHAKIYLYETWGSPFTANEDGTTIAEMEDKIRKAYTQTAENNDLGITYVGAAFTDIKYNTDINLYDTDNRHQGSTGAYLSACTHVCSMLGADVRNTTYDGTDIESFPELGEDTLTALREAAYRAGNGDLVVIEDDTEIAVDEDKATDVLRVAGWGRFIEEQRFDALIDEFERYCNEQNIEYTAVEGVYYNSANYYYIADFTAKAYADGLPDIVLPCATNFNANQATIAAISFTPIDVYNQSNRQVGKITDGDLSDAFIEFVQTDAAKAILGNSTY